MTISVAFRVDMSVAIGAGHMTRCLTLADILAEMGCEIYFISRHITETMCRLIAERRYTLCALPAADNAAVDDLPHSHWLGTPQEADADATIIAVADIHPDWLVVDHYALDERWEDRLASHVGNILVIDDLADRSHHCGILLDQNLQDRNRYDELVSNQCRQLIGPRYALLRPEFSQAAALPKPNEKTRLNIFFGSTDPKGMTIVALAGIRAIDDLAVDVVIGADNPHQQAIATACLDRKGTRLHVQPSNIAWLFSQADLALGAGGTASWERCCVGLPTLIVSVARNQRSGTEALARSGAAIDLGDMEAISPVIIEVATRALLADPARMAAMRTAAQALVDGHGAERVAIYMLRDALQLRPAEQSDHTLAFRWRNAPSVRAQSFDPATLDLAHHAHWWGNSLGRSNRILLMAHCQNRTVGVLRFDQSSECVTVSIYIDPELNGLGLGRRMLIAGEAWLRKNRPGVKSAIALIREDNQPSIRAFTAAGYYLDAGRNSWIRHLRHSNGDPS